MSNSNITIKDNEITTILNAPGLNKIFSINQKREPDRINPLLRNEAIFNLEDTSLFIEDYTAKCAIKIRVFKMLDFLVKCLSEKNQYKIDENKNVDTVIKFSLDEYATLLGKKDIKNPSTRKNMRRIINEALDFIYCLSLESIEQRGGEKVRFTKMRICQMFECKNSVYAFVFTEPFARYLLSSYVMKFPTVLFKIDERNPNAYPIGRKLALHQGINNNKKKGTDKIISVRSLLKIAPEIPTIETVRGKNGSWKERIEEKLESALNILEDFGVIENWEYCNSKGMALTDEQLDMNNYHLFESLKISFSIKGF